MFKIFQILFSSSKASFFFISFILFLSLFSFIFTWNIIYSVDKYIKDTSKDFIWADITINSKEPDSIFYEWYIKDNYDAETSRKISFQTSIFFQNSPELYSINFIEQNYPFYWNFKQKEINQNWELIVSKKVYDKFKDGYLNILWKDYKIKSYLEEDFLADFNPFWWNDIYLNISEFDKEKINAISRVNYDLLIKTDQSEEISKDTKFSELRINTQETSNNSLNEITSRLNLFIQIFYQIIIVLTFFIIIINFESYFKKVIKNIKIINILWFSNYKIIASFFILFFFLAVFSSILAYLLTYIIFNSINFVELKMDIALLYSSIFIAFLIILSWSFLNLIKLKATSISNFESNNFFKNFKSYLVFYFIFLIFILFFIAYFSWVNIISSIYLSIWFILAIVLLIYLLNFVTKRLFSISKRFLKKNFYLYDAFRSTIKPWNLSILIVFSTIISLSWFIIFATFSNWFIDFLNKTSSGKIDTFVININAEDLGKIEDKLNKDEYFEIIRARISKINWSNLKDHLGTDFVSWRFSREFSLTTTNLDDWIIKWKKLDFWEVWVDEDFASDLWIKIWDEIEFLIFWIKKNLKITQIRESNINWVNPFFYFNLYDKEFEWFSKNYFLSYASSEKEPDFNKQIQAELWNQATFINVWSIIEKVKAIADYVLYFVYTILAYITIFSVITFIVSINFLKSFKNKKIYTYSLFWANRNKMKKAVFYEYSYLILLWIIISIIIWIIITIVIFWLNRFIDFEIMYFLKSLMLVWGFIVLYWFIYKILNK